MREHHIIFTYVKLMVGSYMIQRLFQLANIMNHRIVMITKTERAKQLLISNVCIDCHWFIRTSDREKFEHGPVCGLYSFKIMGLPATFGCPDWEKKHPPKVGILGKYAPR